MKKINIFIPSHPKSRKMGGVSEIARSYLANAEAFEIISKVDSEQKKPWIVEALENGKQNAMFRALFEVYWPLLDAARKRAQLMARSEFFYEPPFSDELLEVLAREIPSQDPETKQPPLSREEREEFMKALHIVVHAYEARWRTECNAQQRSRHGGQKPKPAAYTARKARKSHKDKELRMQMRGGAKKKAA